MWVNSLLTILVIIWLIIIYHHIVFPFILKCIYNKNKPTAKRYSTHYKPAITLVIPAYNEAAVIADKIRNLGTLDYPADKLEIIIACDGCTDRTADIAIDAANEEENRHLNVAIWHYKDNIGKTKLLNKVLPQINSEVTALSDASALISIDALYKAAQHFSSPDIAMVAATYQLAKSANAGERRYWTFQTQQKVAESVLGGPVGVHGALYFFRSCYFEPMEADTINDDFILPMRIIQQGGKAIYDPSIIAVEWEHTDQKMDAKRRQRIAAGNMQQLMRLMPLLHPKFKGISFTFGSGKALRAIIPLLLVLQLIVCFLLSFELTLFIGLTATQLLFISIACSRSIISNINIPRVLDLGCYAINGYRHSFIGIIKYILFKPSSAWKPVRTESINGE